MLRFKKSLNKKRHHSLLISELACKPVSISSKTILFSLSHEILSLKRVVGSCFYECGSEREIYIFLIYFFTISPIFIVSQIQLLNLYLIPIFEV